mmetsp:Transcript_116884/g.184892  ORF Transcript_116884/g.184892 Transcript_116884/m.184892 type:complete len:258 (-) Transcript_116884:829-1602(-)
MSISDSSHANIPFRTFFTAVNPAAFNVISANSESTPRFQITNIFVSRAGTLPRALRNASCNASFGDNFCLLLLLTLRTAPAISNTRSTCPAGSCPVKSVKGTLIAPFARNLLPNSSGGRTSTIIYLSKPLFRNHELAPSALSLARSSEPKLSGPLSAKPIVALRAVSSAGSNDAPCSSTGKTDGTCRVQDVVYLKMSSQKIMTPTLPGSSFIRRIAPTTCIPEEGPAMMDSSWFSRLHISKASSFVTSARASYFSRS